MDKILPFDDSPIYIEFEKLVQAIFHNNGFKTEIPSKKNAYDFSAKIDDKFAYVEVKFYKSKLPKLDLLRKAYLRLLSQKDDEKIILILVVSSYITPSLKQEIYKETGVTIWDAKTLFSLAFDYSTLYYDLENILTRAFNEPLDDLMIVDNDYKSTIITSLNSVSTIKAKEPENEGEKLCKDLHALKPGKDDAIKFENKCIDILKYLFNNKTDLTLWETQPTTDDGLHRFDLLCRIISSHQNTFWTELAHDFHTRYVLFEFKNYTEEIKQGQIYTTEKYLFLTALRSVSFIIARNGADNNAIKAAKGALKEAGKLIVILTSEDICNMLKLKDNGDEPAIILRAKIDEMLVKLTRS
ncbi:restriction endonuclease [Flavobacterium denitrificans]|uniref:restriction endonuclease n=1 Tax=Flavobacterium denitrificans TaxID=281361 RepID=UPI000408E148|nr:restriction endonuclease [Flavobacterium denitrificans]